MSPIEMSLALSAALLGSLLVRFWLSTRQMRHVATHRDAVPPAFAGQVSLETHQKAADYTLAKLRFGIVARAFDAAVLIGWTLLGGLGWLNIGVRELVEVRWGTMAYQLALFGAFGAISFLLELPFTLYDTFVLEARFGFNRTSWRTFVVDHLKVTGLTLAIGTPLLWIALRGMHAAGGLWWVWACTLLVVVQLVAMVVGPLWIAPLFNKFEPLQDEALKSRAEALMRRCGFVARGFFVKDGSRRSAHSNAYFTGLGRAKRVVFYDTLIARLTGAEMEAVLAHELGHFARKHLSTLLAVMVPIEFAAFAIAGWLSHQPAAFLGLGVFPNMSAPNDALVLLLFMLAGPPFGYFLQPLIACISRRHEYEADAFAGAHANRDDLGRALLKLHEDNAATLTPDPAFVRFYYSHPPLSMRLAALGIPGAPSAGVAA